jgi:transcriptional regulator with PAS, ATPase and Fis domain
LRVLPWSAAFCHLTQGKLSGVLSSSGFVRKYSQEFKKDVRGLSRGALLVLDGYDWPGNVRELENIIERSVALAMRPVIRLVSSAEKALP